MTGLTKEEIQVLIAKAKAEHGDEPVSFSKISSELGDSIQKTVTGQQKYIVHRDIQKRQRGDYMGYHSPRVADQLQLMKIFSGGLEPKMPPKWAIPFLILFHNVFVFLTKFRWSRWLLNKVFQFIHNRRTS
jgi:hypothetical protein